MADLPQTQPIRTPLAVGSWLAGKWRIERLLGAGGMGIVYEARHRNGNRVAIKALHPELIAQADILRRFLREGLLANAVEHPGVVVVLDDGVSEQGVPFLVMELLSGENLDARLARIDGPLSLSDALSVGVAMLDVLKAAHAVGIIHRDIKPENVFLTSNGGVKLLDFGIAFLLDAMNSGMTSTRPGITVGTPTFMPREQAQGLSDQVDSQSDLWSVGATLFFALTCEFLYEATTAQQFVARLITEPPRRLRSLAPGVPEPIAAVINRALEHDRSKRWASAAEMQQALRDAALQAGVDIPLTPSSAGYINTAVPRTSILDLREEFEASLHERVSFIPGNHALAAQRERSDLHNLETVQSPSPHGPTPTGPSSRQPSGPSSRPPAFDARTPSEPPPSLPSSSVSSTRPPPPDTGSDLLRRWVGPIAAAALAVAAGLWLMRPQQPSATNASSPNTAASSSPVATAMASAALPAPTPSASAATSASAAASAPARTVSPGKKRPGGKAASAGDSDLGASRD